jgi:Tfp pilus assembly protein PilX
MNKHMRYKNLKNNEAGMAAIIVTVILMMVISLIVLGFSQVIRREQRNALDHQLSTQAYYAAESGVNLAQNKVKNLLATGSAIPTKNNCGTSYTGATDFTAAEFNIGQGVDITCLLIEPKVPSLEYQKVDTHAIPMLVKAESGTVSSITISWQAPGNTSAAGCSTSLTPPANSFSPTTGASPNWSCPQPLLRVDVVPIPNLGILGRSDLLDRQYTTFLYPVNSLATGNMNYSAGNITANNAVRCGVVSAPTRPKSCTATINVGGVVGAPLLYGRSFAVRVMSIYGVADISVYANVAGSTNLIEQQILFDVTAKAQDVLRRVQVRSSVTGSAPDFGLVAGGDGSGGICKRYAISAGSIIDPTGTYPACIIP